MEMSANVVTSHSPKWNWNRSNNYFQDLEEESIYVIPVYMIGEAPATVLNALMLLSAQTTKGNK